MNRIKIVTFSGCGATTQLLEELQLLQENQPFDLDLVTVDTPAQAEEMGLYGSPTIYINGIELQKGSNAEPGFY